MQIEELKAFFDSQTERFEKGELHGFVFVALNANGSVTTSTNGNVVSLIGALEVAKDMTKANALGQAAS